MVAPATLATSLADRNIIQLSLLVYNIKFRSAFLYTIRTWRLLHQGLQSQQLLTSVVSSCDRELWPMTLIFELDLDQASVPNK